MFDKFLNHLKSKKFLFISLLIIFFVQIWLVSQLKYLPGPLYGGDVYRERGFTENIAQGYPFYEDPQIKGEVAFRPQFPYIFVAALSYVGLGTIDNIMIYLMVFVVVLSSYGIYLLARQISKNEFASLSATFFYYGSLISYTSSGKHTLSLAFLFTIFFLYFLFKSFETDKLRDKIIGGVFLGLIALSHLENLIGVMVIIISLIVFEIVRGFLLEKHKILSLAKKITHRYLFIILIGIIISLLYFLPIAVFNKTEFLNRVNEYALINIDLLGTGYIINTLSNYFLNFSSISTLFLSIIALIGVIFSISKWKDERYGALIFVFLGGLLSGSHFLITKPLFNFWITPSHIFSVFIFIQLLFFMIGLLVLYSLFKKYKTVLFIIIIFLSVVSLGSSVMSVKESRWFSINTVENQGMDEMYQMRDWIFGNTQKYDIFLANDETAFAVNALTARKMVMLRRVHASQYVDMNKRYADGMVMLYGKNKEKIKSLLSEYDVKYLVVDQFLMNYPLIDDIKYKNYLSENDINFSIQFTRWDPSTEDAPQFESVVVFPQNITLLNVENATQLVYRNSQIAIFKINPGALLT